MARDGIMPRALQDRPKLLAHLRCYYDAFRFLSGRRGASGGMGGIPGIPLSEMRQYADEFGFTDPDTRERLMRYVAALDLAHIEHSVTKSKEQSDTQTKS